MFGGKAEAYPSEAPFRCSTLEYVPALPANIRLGWKGLPGTNVLAYNEKSYLKRFITLVPGANVIKLFTVISYNFS